MAQSPGLGSTTIRGSGLTPSRSTKTSQFSELSRQNSMINGETNTNIQEDAEEVAHLQ